jgi:hypothetical protein
MILGLLVGPASAATVYWDFNGTTLGCGNSGGSWTGSHWNSDSAGGSSGTLSAWPTSGDGIFSAGTDGVGSLTITVTCPARRNSQLANAV